MFNKPEHINESRRVGKPSESLRFRNKLNTKLNNPAYDTIRDTIEEGDNVVSQPQLEKQNTDHLKSHKHERYSSKKSKEIL